MSPPDDADRAARLAAALRENLKRRKMQAKGRIVPDAPPAEVAPAGTATDAAPTPPAAPSRGTTEESG